MCIAAPCHRVGKHIRSIVPECYPPCRLCGTAPNTVPCSCMNLPEPTLDAFRGPLAAALEALVEAYRLSDAGTGSAQDSTPPLLVQAFAQLFEAMQRTEASLAEESAVQTGNQASEQDVSELGEYALELFDQALAWSQRLDLDDVYDVLQGFVIAMGRWIARHGGQIFSLEPVVDALARSANRIQEPERLVPLYRAMGEVMDATAAAIRQDLDKTNPGRPWRILHLNRAIVATRTHHPDIMEEAFSVLIRDLPEDAPGFFSRGMEQMDLLNYPSHVRNVMDRYYRKWSVDRSLH